MSLEQQPRHRSLRQPETHTYFVGRRSFDAAEVYAVTSTDVQRLRSDGEYGERLLDWNRSSRAGMELSHALLSKVAELRPSRDLDERFALYVLAQLPDDGFVLDSSEVWRWLLMASDPQDFAPGESERHSWSERLRTLLRGAEAHSAHD
jgi:hypothetical protein